MQFYKKKKNRTYQIPDWTSSSLTLKFFIIEQIEEIFWTIQSLLNSWVALNTCLPDLGTPGYF